jgi:hypothetical protein
MEDFGIIMGIWTILRPFGILNGQFYAYLVYFFPFWYVVPRQIWQPLMTSAHQTNAPFLTFTSNSNKWLEWHHHQQRS